MDCKNVLNAVEALFPAYIPVWADVCNIESPTKNKAGVDAVGKYMIALAEKHGWQVEICPQKVSGDAICITMNPDADAAPVALSAHMDTVHPVGLFGTPAVHTDTEKIYGPGVVDCKGGFVAAALAMDALETCGFTRRPVQLILQSDEEMGSSPSKLETVRFMCDKAKNAVAFLNLEGSTPGEACIARKGIMTFTFTVTGVMAHAANCVTEGANAIAEAAYKIIEMEKLKDEDGLTCCCSVIEGGTVSNTVPDRCVFKANVRFATAEQQEWVYRYAKNVAKTVHIPGCSCTVTHPTGRPAMEYSERNAELLRTMNRIFAENGLPELAESKRKGGSDAAYVTQAGIPCLDSLGVHGGNIHTQTEFAYLKSLEDAAKRMAAVIYYI